MTNKPGLVMVASKKGKKEKRRGLTRDIATLESERATNKRDRVRTTETKQIDRGLES